MTAFDTEGNRYDRWFDSAEGRQIFAEELACLRHVIGEVTGHWLEVGVGTGRFAQALGIQEGLDPSSVMLAMAAQRSIHTCIARAEQLPYDDNTFDGLLMVTTFSFLDDPPKALRQCRRVLKPRAKLVLAIVPVDSPWGQLYTRKGQSRRSFYQTAQFRTCRQVIRLAVDAGFLPEGAQSCLLRAPGELAGGEASKTGVVPKAGFVSLLFRNSTIASNERRIV